MFGAPKGAAGYTYYGGIAQVICLGPVKILHEIRNGDTVIWSGPITRSSADAFGKSVITTTMGTLNFYWGTADQTPDPILSGVLLDLGAGPQLVPIPAWPWVCYVTGVNVCFGNQKSPPQLQFELTVEPEDLALSAHLINGDAVIPEVIYQYLTRELLGLGINAAQHIDTASFEAAGETVIAEGIGVSPSIDSNSTAREIIGKLLQYVDGVLYFKDGKIAMRLIRAESTAGVQAITIADMLDEPRPVNEGESETWNVTNVSFTDRDAKHETSTEPYHDLANLAQFEGTRCKEVSLPFIRTRDVAKKLAKLIGVKGGIVPMSWTLQLKPKWASLVPGDRLFITYPKLEIEDRLVRITAVDRGTPENPEIQITVTEETTRDVSHDYVPEDEQTFTIRSTYDQNGQADTLTSTVPRLSWLPESLKLGYPDGFLVACNRPDNTTTAVDVFYTWNPGITPYKQLMSQRSFPAAGTVVCFHRVRDTNWMLRIKCDSAADVERLKQLLETSDVYAVTAHRKVKLVGTAQDQHQVMAGWARRVAGGYSDIVSADTIDVEVQAGQFGTDALTLETVAGSAIAPAAHVYVGRHSIGEDSDFVIVRSTDIAFERNEPNAPAFKGVSQDTALIRYVKAPVSKGGQSQSVSELDAVTYDRDDTTMCPDGTYSSDWGARAKSTYELFDLEAPSAADQAPSTAYQAVQDIDTALEAVLMGAATAVQVLLVEDIDKVLGTMLGTGSRIYNDVP